VQHESKPLAQTNIPEDTRSVSSAAGSVLILIGYGLAIAAAELIVAHLHMVTGTVLHALLLFTLLCHYGMARHAAYRSILVPLALLPLLRILSLTMALKDIPPLYWYILVGSPLLLGILYAINVLDWQRTALSWGRLSWWKEPLVALSGLPLGYAAYMLAQPEPLIANATGPELALVALMLVVFVALPEEILFRGLLLRASSERLGPYAILYSSLLFAVTYIGTLDWQVVLFMGLVGLVFGTCVYKTNALWGVIAAHSVLVIELLVLLPVMLA